MQSPQFPITLLAVEPCPEEEAAAKKRSVSLECPARVAREPARRLNSYQSDGVRGFGFGGGVLRARSFLPTPPAPPRRTSASPSPSAPSWWRLASCKPRLPRTPSRGATTTCTCRRSTDARRLDVLGARTGDRREAGEAGPRAGCGHGRLLRDGVWTEAQYTSTSSPRRPSAPQAGQVYPSVMPTAARGLPRGGDRRDAAVQYSRGGEGRGATVL